MDLEIKAAVLAALKTLRDAPDTIDITSGLCSNVDSILGAEEQGYRRRAFYAVIESWPFYSGDPVYPIPPTRADAGCDVERYHTHPRTLAMRAFDDVLMSEEPDFWDVSTEYGQMRWELLDWLIATLETPV